mmetsp:Transcript_3568/g.12591  ORF Transcript_3568/g.12591 Transcript_3568/m.12591 type:complete len:218 (-) Transcript_3568:150-803(-)
MEVDNGCLVENVRKCSEFVGVDVQIENLRRSDQRLRHSAREPVAVERESCSLGIVEIRDCACQVVHVHFELQHVGELANARRQRARELVFVEEQSSKSCHVTNALWDSSSEGVLRKPQILNSRQLPDVIRNGPCEARALNKVQLSDRAEAREGVREGALLVVVVKNQRCELCVVVVATDAVPAVLAGVSLEPTAVPGPVIPISVVIYVFQALVCLCA